jgi:hypothetical protein
MTASTVLDLGSTFTLSDYAARGITQTLDPIEAATSLRRTVNGALVSIASTQFKKYRSVISCVVSGSSRTEGSWTYYRPELTMRVVRLTTSTNEWGAVVGWTLELEEV